MYLYLRSIKSRQAFNDPKNKPKDLTRRNKRIKKLAHVSRMV